MNEMIGNKLGLTWLFHLGKQHSPATAAGHVTSL